MSPYTVEVVHLSEGARLLAWIGETIEEVEIDMPIQAVPGILDEIENELVRTLLPLFDTEMEVVFYDITTVSVEGECELDGDLREHGKSNASRRYPPSSARCLTQPG